MQFVLRGLLLVLLLMSGSLVGAQASTPEATPESSNDLAWIRFAHISADSPAVDIYLDGEILVEALEFVNISAYFGVAPGQHEVTVVPTGEPIDAALQKRAGDLTAGHTYVVGVSGLQASGSFSVFVLDETWMLQAPIESAPEMGEPDTLGRFIVLHAIENGPAVNIVFQTGETVATNLEYGGYYVSPVIPGSYPLMILTADEQDVVFNQLNPLEIRSGLLYFIVMTGTSADPQLLFSITGTKTVEEILNSSDTISTFANAVNASGLLETATEPVTVFVPSNGAFEEAGEPGDLDSILRYHIVPGIYQLNEIAQEDSLTTLSGEDIIVGNSASDNSQLSVLLNETPLEFSGVLALNGIVYVINAVLTPPQ